MKTAKLIEKLFEYEECVGTYRLSTWMFKEIIKRLEELEELKQCSIMGEGGKWVHVKDIQLVSSIIKE